MSLYKRGDVWWYKFRFAGRLVRESAKTESKTIARDAEKQRRRELEQGFNNLGDHRAERVESLSTVADTYLASYELKHRSIVYARYALGHVKRHLGGLMLVDFNDRAVKTYQLSRLKEGAAPKSINEEVGFLLRLLGDAGEAIRGKLRREKGLKLAVPPTIGRPYSTDEKQRLLSAAKAAKSPMIYPALTLALNAGLRDAEIRNLTWDQVDLETGFLTVGRSKTTAGTGRTIPLNSVLWNTLLAHSRWYEQRFSMRPPGWYLFPSGKANHLEPNKPISTLSTAWRNVRTKAKVEGRWHDTRHTLITELAESGAGDQTIMDIAGHVSRQMLARYSHIRMQAKRHALEQIVPAPPKDQQTAEENARSTSAGAQNGAQPNALEQTAARGSHRKSLKKSGSSGRTRTYNISVNSRTLYH